MFGIEDPKIWGAYLLAIGITLISLVHTIFYWNYEDSETITADDENWVKEEKQVEEAL